MAERYTQTDAYLALSWVVQAENRIRRAGGFPLVALALPSGRPGIRLRAYVEGLPEKRDLVPLVSWMPRTDGTQPLRLLELGADSQGREVPDDLELAYTIDAGRGGGTIWCYRVGPDGKLSTGYGHVGWSPSWGMNWRPLRQLLESVSEAFRWSFETTENAKRLV